VSDRKGCIAEGFDADLVVFSPEETFTVTNSALHFRHPVSPYVGHTLNGVVKKTFVRGRCVFDEGRFSPENFGREVAA
jgi:allantoinase